MELAGKCVIWAPEEPVVDVATTNYQEPHFFGSKRNETESCVITNL